MTTFLLTLSLLACDTDEAETPPETEVVEEAPPEVVEAPPETVDAPADVAAAPADATVTETGLAYKVLTKGTGATNPGKYDKVSVHYSGWTTDGEMFDSSVTRGEQSSFPLNRVIPGWTEGLGLMTVGEKTRFWIPVELAYNGAPGKPAGMLVFDVELFSIEAGPQVPADVAAAPASADKRGTGAHWKLLTKGDGSANPTGSDTVSFDFTVWSPDGELQESTIQSGRTVSAPLEKIEERTPVWADELKEMVSGETRIIWAPAASLALPGRPPPPSDLVFVLTLNDIVAPPKAPADVAAPPADAKKTPSGLAYKVLTAGSGESHPAATDSVSVHYTGWTTDGEMFDSSVTRGQPSSFPLNRVIAGWTEGLQLMSPGEKTIFWIPEELAYAGQPGKPAGMLVFEVELLEIK
ncbi:MAG: FKBP-type peptidylprolyl isomerase [Proteobacteria bacterium]|nr:FKBP-type peptidylprolyl isomerase [Pseudomonadota bacterium]